MPSIFIVYRWLTFAFFIICNTIICSVAAGNLGFASAVSRVVAIDSYWIAISALGLVFIFPIIFVDVSRKGAIPTRVWFELTWTALFWIVEFAGAAALTAISPGALCGVEVSAPLGSSCSTANVLVVFSWLCFGSLFVYFVALALFAIMHAKEDNRVWDSGVREYRWFETKECLRSAPGTPIKSMFQKKTPSLAAPKARRPPPIFIQQRAGISSRYEIEHYSGTDEVLDRPPVAAAPVAPPKSDPLSFYPQHVQTTMRNVPMQQSSTYSSANPSNSPPPIRNWPRQIHEPSSREQRALERSGTKGKRRAAPEEVAAQVQERSAPAPVTVPAARLPAPPPSPSRSRPSGPRTRSVSTTNARSRSRPPPLDLSLVHAKPMVRR